MSRRKNREQAFLLIFEKSFTEYEIPEIVSLALESRDLILDEEVKVMVESVFDNIDAVDEAINSHVKGRKSGRVSHIARSVMRLAVYELLFDPEIDAAVSINEAVVLTKKYSAPEEAAFVNGVLSSISKEVK